MRCDRCTAPTNSREKSRFNADLICPSCVTVEKAHHYYRIAVNYEHKAMEEGDHYYEGVGLPDDLKP